MFLSWAVTSVTLGTLTTAVHCKAQFWSHLLRGAWSASTTENHSNPTLWPSFLQWNALIVLLKLSLAAGNALRHTWHCLPLSTMKNLKFDKITGATSTSHQLDSIFIPIYPTHSTLGKVSGLGLQKSISGKHPIGVWFSLILVFGWMEGKGVDRHMQKEH